MRFIFLIGLVFFNVSAEDKGFHLPADLVSNNYSLMVSELDTKLLTKHILATNKKLNNLEASEISKEIILVSDCFQIDPWILMGLVQKESSYNQEATSPTGAAGLTQFTEIGFREVNDQLGLNGRAGAPDSTTLYYSQKIRSCIDPSWVDLWNRVNVKEDDPQFYSLLKLEVKKNTAASLVYGAILLKTYVAHITERNLSAPVPLKLSEIYFEALKAYNGEPGEAKVNYAKAIFINLKSIYPKPVTFPFLK